MPCRLKSRRLLRGGFGFRNVILALGVLAGAGMIIIEVLKNRGMQK